MDSMRLKLTRSLPFSQIQLVLQFFDTPSDDHEKRGKKINKKHNNKKYQMT